jgi:prepilin-type N-terminal cleavage/methylation domain-containing protein
MRTHKLGFTLAELLIALAILGVIATFTIPKVLQSTTSGQNTAVAKEAASMISGAFSAYQMNNQIAATTTAGVLTQFMNYVKTDTATNVNGMAADCAALNTSGCLVLHNGAYLQYDGDSSFNADADATLETSDHIIFNVDPDGGTGTSGPATEITFVLFSNGRLTTGQHAGTITEDAGIAAITTDPSYLQNWN